MLVAPMDKRQVSPTSDPGSPRGSSGPDDDEQYLEDCEEKPYKPFVETQEFTAVMGIIVLVHMVFIGLQTDAEATGDDSIPYGAFTSFFLLVYLLELSMRLLFRGSEALKDILTVLDCILVLAAFMETATSGGGFARALPAARLARVFSVYSEHPWFKSSRTLDSLVTNAKTASTSLIWQCIMLALALFAASVICRGAIGKSAQWVGSMDPHVPHEAFEPFDVREYFGSVPRSVLSTMQIMTQSHFASHIGRQVMMVYPIATLLFYVLVFGTSYGLMQGVIANIVQASMTSSATKEAANLELQRETRKRVGRNVTDMLKLIDLDGGGTLDEYELEEALKNPEIQLVEMMKSLGVPKEIITAESLIRIFDKDGSGDVDYEEMVRGLVSMDDDISPRDYQLLGLRVQYVFMRSKSLYRRVERLSDQITSLRQFMQNCVDSVEFMNEHRQVTQLHFQAVKSLREMPAVGPPKIHDRPKTPPPRPPSGSGNYYMHYSKRVMGSTRDTKPESDGVPHRNPGDPPLARTVVAAICAGRGVLPDPPGPFEKVMAQARRETEAIDLAVDNKYKIRKFDPDIGGIREAPSLMTLKSLLASESR